MQRRSLLGAASAAALARPARASSPALVLVELFTSQGCSSCPSADASFARLVGRADVLPLAYHVTYWDRLGWRDTLGDPAFTERQRWYADLLGRGLYTPQLVIGGELDLVGSDPRLEQALELVAGQRRPVPLDLDGAGIALPALPLANAARLLGIGFEPLRRVSIGAGENAGATIDYHNAVRALVDLGAWDGTRQQIALPSGLTIYPDLAVLAQDPSTGRVVALGRRTVPAARPGALL